MQKQITKLILATHNIGKITEFQRMLDQASLDISIIGADDVHLPEPEETGTSFAENAELKARHAALFTNLPAIADDSGFCLDALDGAPGLYSKRFMEECRDYPTAFKNLRTQLIDKDQTARFVCHLCLYFPDGTKHAILGETIGHFTYPPQGLDGFGYDPVFTAQGHKKTFGQMTKDDKNALSHRGKAFNKLIKVLKTYA